MSTTTLEDDGRKRPRRGSREGSKWLSSSSTDLPVAMVGVDAQAYGELTPTATNANMVVADAIERTHPMVIGALASEPVLECLDVGTADGRNFVSVAERIIKLCGSGRRATAATTTNNDIVVRFTGMSLEPAIDFYLGEALVDTFVASHTDSPRLEPPERKLLLERVLLHPDARIRLSPALRKQWEAHEADVVESPPAHRIRTETMKTIQSVLDDACIAYVEVDYVQGSFYAGETWERATTTTMAASRRFHIVTSLTADHWLAPACAPLRSTTQPLEFVQSNLCPKEHCESTSKQWQADHAVLLAHIKRALHPVGGRVVFGGLVQDSKGQIPAHLGYALLRDAFLAQAKGFHVDFNSYFPTDEERSAAIAKAKFRTLPFPNAVRVIECGVTARYAGLEIPKSEQGTVCHALRSLVESWSRWKIARAEPDCEAEPRALDVNAVFADLERRFVRHVRETPTPVHGYLPYPYSFRVFAGGEF